MTGEEAGEASLSPSNADIERLRSLLDGSSSLPISIDEYIRGRQLDLAAKIAGRDPIYLDSRFWIELRRADEIGGASSRSYPLLLALRQAVSSGRAFCPISTSTFVEMLKHSEAGVRRKSAKLVDELSLGISLVAIDELLDAEIRWFIDNPGDHPLQPLKQPVWTRLAYALGTVIPTLEGMSSREMLAMRVVAFDAIWASTLEEVSMALPEPMRPDFKDAAAKITSDSAAHVHEIPTYDSAYLSELATMAKMGAPFFATHIRRKAEEKGIATPEADDEAINLFGNIIRNSLALGKARQPLRSAHIRASLHAIIRRNKERKFRSNDIFDIEHAVAGVGYCKAFFTEASLGTALTQPPLSLDKLYGCFVTSDIEAAARFVMDIE